MARQAFGLMLEQPSLAVEAAAVAAQAAVGADDAVAGDDDRDRVLAVGPADGPARARLTDAPGQLGVGDRAAVRNSAQLMPDPALEGCAGEIQLEIKASSSPPSK